MKKVGGFIRDCVEKYIPAVAFTVLFLVGKRKQYHYAGR